MNYQNFTRTLPIESSIIMNSLIVQHIRNINIPPTMARNYRSSRIEKLQIYVKKYKYFATWNNIKTSRSVNAYVHIYSTCLFIYHMCNIIISIFYTCSSILLHSIMQTITIVQNFYCIKWLKSHLVDLHYTHSTELFA